MENLGYLNLGCGQRYLPEWTNVDFVKTGPGVVPHNLLEGIPFADNTFEVVYHSHVLEHFSKRKAVDFMEECYRVLKPNGVLRIAVPDLEQIAKLYLSNLKNVRISYTDQNRANYYWSVIEMYDQAVRNISGGEMGEYWSQIQIINEDFLIERMGEEFLNYRRNWRNSPNQAIPSIIKNNYGKSFFEKVRRMLLMWLSREPRFEDYLSLGQYRSSGEIHQWMYDEFSLSELLKNLGFQEIIKKDAFTSCIVDWPMHSFLDLSDGKARKPDSLFLEARKF